MLWTTYIFRIYINSCCQMPNDGYLYQIWHIDYRYGKTSFALILKFNWVLHGFTKWISKACLIEILVLYSNFLIYSYGLQIHDISQYCKCTLSKICNDLYVLWKSWGRTWNITGTHSLYLINLRIKVSNIGLILMKIDYI